MKKKTTVDFEDRILADVFMDAAQVPKGVKGMYITGLEYGRMTRGEMLTVKYGYTETE